MSEELLHVDVGDLTFDVRADGPEDGRPVLLLHGFPETSASWAAVSPLLARAGLRTYAPDQLGYSPAPGPTRWAPTPRRALPR
jgi:pimeloyl-ACP methyl ester carboxylesterase